MRLKPLGQTGLSVSEFGLGTWAMGGGIYGVVDDAESIRTIHRAAELGINTLDTAPMYGIGERRDGRAERVVGEAIKGHRDNWIVMTKFGRHLNGNPNWVDMDEDYSGRRAIQSVEQSLRRLQTDRIDVLFVHSPPRNRFEAEDAFGEMERMREQGKIRVVGFSFWESVADTLDLVEPYLRSGLVGAVQVIHSLLRPEATDLLFPIVRETGTGVVSREALANGFLTDSFTAEEHFDAEHNKSNMSRELIQARLDQAEKFRFLVEQNPQVASLPEAALLWTISHPEVSCVIPGAKTVAELEQCLTVADKPYLSREMLQRADIDQSDFRWRF